MMESKETVERKYAACRARSAKRHHLAQVRTKKREKAIFRTLSYRAAKKKQLAAGKKNLPNIFNPVARPHLWGVKILSERTWY